MPFFAPLIKGEPQLDRIIDVSEEIAAQVLRPQAAIWKTWFEVKDKPKEEVKIPVFQQVEEAIKSRGRPKKNHF